MSEHRENEHFTNGRKNMLPFIALFIAGGYLLATCMLVAFLIGFLMGERVYAIDEGSGVWCVTGSSLDGKRSPMADESIRERWI